MTIHDTLTTEAILDVFTAEVENCHGRVADTFHDGQRLIVRSLLPHVGDARPKDSMQGGLALRATDEELWLHPYLFRRVCRNGAVMAQAIESLHVECLGSYTLEEGTVMLREAIAQCAEEQVFTRSMHQIRTSATIEADTLLNLIPHLTHFRRAGMERILGEILSRFSGERDRTVFGLMNAVTSVARDTQDPDDRWRLEEMGGGIGSPPTELASRRSGAATFRDRVVVDGLSRQVRKHRRKIAAGTYADLIAPISRSDSSV